MLPAADGGARRTGSRLRVTANVIRHTTVRFAATPVKEGLPAGPRGEERSPQADLIVESNGATLRIEERTVPRDNGTDVGQLPCRTLTLFAP
jgi:hypothetical protein